jgi:release factor glutamine methyltransferase
MTTVRAFLARATGRPSEASGPPRCPAREVWTLGCHVLRRPLAWLLAVDANEPLNPTDEARWRALIARRAQGEPLAYLVGHAEFWSLTLTVTPDVLVPRPETEILVEQALGMPAIDGACYLDAGTGSGAVALALKKERPQALVAACDRSPAALAVARANAAALGLDVAFWNGSWTEAIAARSCDLVVSNPPYVESTDPCLDDDGLRYEPRGALDGGADGLRAIAALIPAAARVLRPGGRLLIEHGAEQGGPVRSLFERAGLADVATHPDYAGHPRVTGGLWHG